MGRGVGIESSSDNRLDWDVVPKGGNAMPCGHEVSEFRYTEWIDGTWKTWCEGCRRRAKEEYEGGAWRQ